MSSQEALFDVASLRPAKQIQPLEQVKRPILVAYGLGLDSSAMFMGMLDRGIRPDAALLANTGGEKEETYRYLPVMQKWLKNHRFPKVTVVRYRPKSFLRYPPYSDLETNCLSNGTLPSLAFGFKSCSLKWKAAPQEAWTKSWEPAARAWAVGDRVVKLIGFDASPADVRRKNHAGSEEDPLYEYRYPLQEWGWTREACVERVVAERIPGWHPGYLQLTTAVTDAWKEFVAQDTEDAHLGFRKAVKLLKRAAYWVQKGGVPMKSSCFYCPAMKIWEVCMLPREKLERIVIMEARAEPRLKGCEGLWRTSTKIKPGSMTKFIASSGLLEETRIEKLRATVPPELMNAVGKWRGEGEETDWQQFFERNGVIPQSLCGDGE